MKELKESAQRIQAQGRTVRWNPVKELKDDKIPYDIPTRHRLWNPVKELKVTPALRFDCVEELVESGEGIESSFPTTST